MKYSVKVMLPKKDRNEYITTLHVEALDRNDAINTANDMMKRRPWLRLSSIELTKLIFETKTLN